MDNLETLVAALAQELKEAAALSRPVIAETPKGYTQRDYPMLEKHHDAIRTPTGKSMDEITLEKVLDGTVTMADVRISPEMLRAQADIAQDAGKPAMGENLRRAAELTNVPDQEVIRMYDMLRPNRSSKEQLYGMAKTLEERYGAPLCAALVREAALVYEKRGILKEG